MHLPSDQNRSELLAVPSLIRFDYCKGFNNMEPTLLIKGNSLLLKYILSGVRTKLAFAICEDRLLYALKVFDDGNEGSILWSIAEKPEELKAIQTLLESGEFVAFLYNEIAINVSWANLQVHQFKGNNLSQIDRVTFGDVDYDRLSKPALYLLDQIDNDQESLNNWMIMDIVGPPNWKPLMNHVITAQAGSSLINVFDQNEGHQQEQIGFWLLDSLKPSGAYHSPQRPYKGDQTQELIDILINYEFGSILIESKILSIFSRPDLPDQTKLKRKLPKDISKGFTQLSGASRQIKKGAEITSKDGKVIAIERDKPNHSIVLIPDFALIEDKTQYGLDFIENFMKQTGDIPHILDTSELLRVVQAAEIIAENSKHSTVIMAFDYYLSERIETAIKANTLCIEVLLK